MRAAAFALMSVAATVSAVSAAAQVATPAGRPAPAASLSAFAGQHALTSKVTARLTQEQGDWWLAVGKGKAHPVKQFPGGWQVPALGIELAVDGQGTLWLARYGERVALAGPGALRADTVPTEQLLTRLAPRAMIAHNVPGVSIALIRDRKLAWLGQFGVTAAGGAKKIGSDTVFEAASMSKPVFAYVAMQLVQQGRLDLDKPLVAILGTPYVSGDPRHEKITARMALSHTTGFPNWRPGGSRSGAPLLTGFEPGARFGYSGEGILFLQRAVEKLLGERADQFMMQRLLRPIGMTHSSYVWEPRFATDSASGHDAAGKVREPRRLYRSANAAFTLYTTPRDYAQFLIETMRADPAGPHSLDRATRAAMLTPAVDTTRTPIQRAGRAPERRQFALGWAVDTLGAGKRYNHSGSNGTGFRSHAEFDPATGNGIVIMANGASGAAVWAELIDAVG